MKEQEPCKECNSKIILWNIKWFSLVYNCKLDFCTDQYADNYNSNATVDDGTCSGYPDNGDYVLSFDGENDLVQLNKKL